MRTTGRVKPVRPMSRSRKSGCRRRVPEGTDGGAWQVVGDSWEEDRGVWRRIADIAPRDHQSLVENNRGGMLMYGGIPAARTGPWPTDTWELQGGPGSASRLRARPGEARRRSPTTANAGRSCCSAASARLPDRINPRRSSAIPGSGTENVGARNGRKRSARTIRPWDGVR